jgi:flagellar hook-length control protein FliK
MGSAPSGAAEGDARASAPSAVQVGPESGHIKAGGDASARAATGRASASTTPDGADGVDRVRFVQRVSRAFEALQGRQGTVRMKLHPPELGSLRVEINVERGVMSARLEAETQHARNLILDNLPMLRDRLAQQDIKVQQFNVDLMDQSPGGLPEQQGGEQSDDRHDGAGQHRHRRDTGRDDDRSTADRPRRHYSNSELDVLI